jgi:NADPH:quinone reductase-like Zn-dependent oxidoreductase
MENKSSNLNLIPGGRRSSSPGLTDVMNAVRLHVSGGPAGLVYEQIEKPHMKAGEALIRVYAAAITRDELDWPVNRLPAIPSYEFSGVVVAVAPGVEDVIVGESVYALSPFDRDGTAADYISIPQEFLSPKPETLGYNESAAIPLAALSAWQGLFTHGNLVKGQQRVLIHGAAGGVGSFAVQFAHQRGAYVIATASKTNIDNVRGLGADEVIDYAATRFDDVVQIVDLVFDTVGGDVLERSPSVMRPGGRLVSVSSEPSQDRASACGITALYFVVEPDRGQLSEITRLADNSVIWPTIDMVFPLANARQAFERCQSSHRMGKIILQIA